MAVLAVPLELALCVALSRTTAAWLARLLRSRRGRDSPGGHLDAVMVFAVCGVAVFAGPRGQEHPGGGAVLAEAVRASEHGAPLLLLGPLYGAALGAGARELAATLWSERGPEVLLRLSARPG